MRKLLILALIIGLYRTVSFAQQNPDWIQESPAVAWQARDSQAELVYNNKLWIFGGWFNSKEAPPRDVWNSADGKKWNLINNSAPWIHSDLSMSIVFKNKMWMMGGWYNGRLEGHSASNKVCLRSAISAA